MAKITVAYMRELEQKVRNSEITYSRMVEMLNEKKNEPEQPLKSTQMADSKNLVEGITDEILRVMAIKTEYLSLPNGVGKFAAMLMEQAIDNARKAQGSGDIMQMIPAFNALKEFKL